MELFIYKLTLGIEVVGGVFAAGVVLGAGWMSAQRIAVRLFTEERVTQRERPTEARHPGELGALSS